MYIIIILYIYIYIYIQTHFAAQLAKDSDIQAVTHRLNPWYGN